MFSGQRKSYRIIFLYLISFNLYSAPMMPMSPQNIIGGDSVRGRDGTTCTQGTHNGPTLDFGITGTRNSADNSSMTPITVNNYNYNTENTATSMGGDVGVYARVIIPLGNDPERLDCTRLYNLEIERLTIELENLKKAGSSSITVE